MANDLNRCEFIGRLGKDVELRYTSAGDAICNFSIACGWKSKDKEGVEWVRVTAFGKLAGVCGQYLKKGSQVYVAGRFTTRKWEKDGVTQYSTEINLDQMQMLGDKQEREAPANEPSANLANVDDDLPF
jgi:single-strand DNA-binding protein